MGTGESTSKEIFIQNGKGDNSYMRKVIVAAHGRFPDGILDAMQRIMGDVPGIAAMNAFVEADFDIETAVKSCMEGLAEGDELIVVTDMFGGSVNNEFMKYAGREGIHLLTGLNLPLLLELVGNLEEEGDTADILRGVAAAADDTIIYCNDALRTFRSRRTSDGEPEGDAPKC
jgi:fructoselysine and glucoselysine-specific PTS system IIA component